MLPITILYHNTLCCFFFFNAITISTVSILFVTTKGPDACLRATLTPIRLLATVITFSCLLYSTLVTLW